MPPAPAPPEEQKRLASLRDLGILDSPPDAEFDALVRAASLACGVPVGLISLIDEDRQWFKANIGLEGVSETPRDLAFCGHTILFHDILEICDAASDPRFADNALVAGQPFIRFYAGVPLRLASGDAVGTLCVIDFQPRQLDDRQREILRNLGQAAASALEGWRARRKFQQVAQQLHESKERLQRNYESSPAMLHSVDEHGVLLTVSDRWLKTLGFTREEVIGKKSCDFLTPASKDYYLVTALPHYFATGEADDIALQMVRKDGSVLDVLLSGFGEEHDGRRYRYAVIEDITARLTAERALAAEHRRLSNLIDSTGMGTWERNLQTGEVRFNERWAEMIGFTLAELAPLSERTWYERMHPDDVSRASDLLDEHLAGRTDRYEIEFRIEHRDGHYVWALSRGKIVTYTEDGRPEWVFGVRKDISDRKRQEEELRKSQDFLNRTGRVAGVGGWEIDLISGQLVWSAETYRIIGLPLDYQPDLETAIGFYAPEARPVIRSVIDHAIASGEGWDVELPFIRPDGSRILVRVVGAASLAAGKPVRLSGAFQDTTDLVAKRIELQNANERLKLATDSGGIGIWDWEVREDRLSWDARMFTVYGYEPQDGLTYDFWFRHLHPDDRVATDRAMQAALAGEAEYDTEFRIIRHDGSLRHVRGAGRVTRDAAGQPVRMVGVNWDVTESRELAAELRRQMDQQAEAAERMSAVFRNSPDVLSIIRVEDEAGPPQFRYEVMSPAFTKVTGWREENFSGQLLQDCLPPEAAESAARECLECITKGETISYSVTLATPKGKREFEGSRTPIRHPGSGRIVRIANAMRDVTERNRLEAAQHHGQKMEAIGRLAAGVAHDFNNILQSISGSLELVQDSVSPGSSAHEYTSIGLRSAKRGSYLTHHLLSYARKQLLRPQLIELPVLLSDIEKLLARTLGPHISVAIRTDKAVQTVRADPGQIQTALLNLAINASHAMEGGGALLIESRAVRLEGQNWVSISVSDTGIGMDEATLARAVEPFFTTKGLNGTGLGLSMVQGFAEQSGGHLSITSELGRGTTVTLQLPASKETAAERARVAAEGPQSSARVLVVDDDPDVLVTTGAFLEKAGFTITRAANANEALRVIADGLLIDAIVTDYAMPGMNGSDLITEARTSRPGLPGIIISGFTDLTESAGLADAVVLHKPFQRDALVAALQAMLGVQAQER